MYLRQVVDSTLPLNESSKKKGRRYPPHLHDSSRSYLLDDNATLRVMYGLATTYDQDGR
jgi:hypothetical protein